MGVGPVSRWAVCVGAIVGLASCGGGGPSSTGSAAQQKSQLSTPSPDLVTTNYIALVHNYWIQYKTAEGDLNHISGTSTAPFGDQDAARACFGLASPTVPQDVNLVDPPTCARLSTAMVAVHRKFLSDLNMTPAPPRFGREDQAFKTQLPKAIADMQAMIAASATSNKQDVVDATASYVSAMIPVVTEALNSVDPSVVHN